MKHQIKPSGRIAPLFLTAFFCLLHSPASSAEPDDNAQPPLIEHIVVTATKREQSVQDVPISVSAFTGDALSQRGISDISELQQVAPSLLVNTSNSTSNGGTLRIRGIGTMGNNIGLEAAVGFFQDGSYRSRSGHALSEIFDVERVEVLRGPQGTLFGKNTSAGAISVMSAEPEFERAGSFSISAGERGHQKIEGMLTGALAEDRLAFRLSAMSTERDGYMKDTVTGKKYNDRDRWAARGQLLWLPQDNLTVRLIVDRMEKDEYCCAASFNQIGPTGPLLQLLGGSLALDSDGRSIGVNAGPSENVEDSGAVLSIKWVLDNAELTSISSYRSFDAERRQDIDFTNVSLFSISHTVESFDTWSQELRLAGSSGSLDWLVGAYVSNEELQSTGNPLVTLGTQGPAYFSILLGAPVVAQLLQPGDGVSARFKQEGDSWALFTNNTWHFQDDWYLNAGLRYSSETKDGGSIVNEDGTAGVVDNNWPCTLLPVPTFCGNAGYALSRDEDRLVGTIKLGYQASDDVHLFAGFSNGFKAGGFNLDPLAYKLDPTGNVLGDGREFEEETVESYELGMKSTWLDGRLTLNGSLFYSKFDDFQVNTFTGTVFAVRNVPEVVTHGVELEQNLAIDHGINLQWGITYADASYTDDTPILNPSGGPTNLEDRQLTNAPRWQSSVALQVDRELARSWRYMIDINWMFRSGYNTGSDLDPQKEQGSFSLVNAQLGVRSPSGRFETSLWVRNASDTSYRQYVFDSVLQPGSWHQTVAEPRLWGVTFRLGF